MPQASGLQFTAHVGELPSDLFSVVGFTLTERLSELFHGRLELASTDPDIDAAEVLEQPVDLVVWQDDIPLRRFTGVVYEFARADSGHRRTRYEVVVQPPLWRLGLMHNSRIFQAQTTDTIVRTLLEERGIVNSVFDLKRAPRSGNTAYSTGKAIWRSLNGWPQKKVGIIVFNTAAWMEANSPD